MKEIASKVLVSAGNLARFVLFTPTPREREQTLWVTRLDESLALLDEVAGQPCECDPSWGEGVNCVQCSARDVQNHLRNGYMFPISILSDTVESVLCHIDDFGVVEFTPDHELECIRYWSNGD